MRGSQSFVIRHIRVNSHAQDQVCNVGHSSFVRCVGQKDRVQNSVPIAVLGRIESSTNVVDQQAVFQLRHSEVVACYGGKDPLEVIPVFLLSQSPQIFVGVRMCIQSFQRH